MNAHQVFILLGADAEAVLRLVGDEMIDQYVTLDGLGWRYCVDFPLDGATTVHVFADAQPETPAASARLFSRGFAALERAERAGVWMTAAAIRTLEG